MYALGRSTANRQVKIHKTSQQLGKSYVIQNILCWKIKAFASAFTWINLLTVQKWIFPWSSWGSREARTELPASISLCLGLPIKSANQFSTINPGGYVSILGFCACSRVWTKLRRCPGTVLCDQNTSQVLNTETSACSASQQVPMDGAPRLGSCLPEAPCCPVLYKNCKWIYNIFPDRRSTGQLILILWS